MLNMTWCLIVIKFIINNRDARMERLFLCIENRVNIDVGDPERL